MGIKAFDKIAAGLKESIAIARGGTEPSRIYRAEHTMYANAPEPTPEEFAKRVREVFGDGGTVI